VSVEKSIPAAKTAVSAGETTSPSSAIESGGMETCPMKGGPYTTARRYIGITRDIPPLARACRTTPRSTGNATKTRIPRTTPDAIDQARITESRLYTVKKGIRSTASNRSGSYTAWVNPAMPILRIPRYAAASSSAASGAITQRKTVHPARPNSSFSTGPIENITSPTALKAPTATGTINALR